jgi:predicted TIM-barrel fold metal-dependent hydrolase
MDLFDVPKVDCHCHILDPQRFSYAADTAYRPAGQESGSADYFKQLLRSYGVRHALLVGPNSGYGLDNRCLLDAIAQGNGVFKGVAVLPNDASLQQLQALQAQGIVGVAFNMALQGLDYYDNIGPLLERLQQLGMFAQVQVEGAQMQALAPLLSGSGVRVLVDHCGRPDLSQGEGQPGFQSLLGLASTGRAVVKLSGLQKFSQQDYPFADASWVVRALLQAFGPQQCLWASDWPFLKASQRLDYGPLLQRFEALVPDAAQRNSILWDTPRRLFGFAD